MSPDCAASSHCLLQKLMPHSGILWIDQLSWLPTMPFSLFPERRWGSRTEMAETWPLWLVSRSVVAARLGSDAATLVARASSLACEDAELARVPPAPSRLGTTYTERDADHALPSPTNRGRCGCKQLIHQRLRYIFNFSPLTALPAAASSPSVGPTRIHRQGEIINNIANENEPDSNEEAETSSHTVGLLQWCRRSLRDFRI